jgi:2-keto-4-pentenoate hydratase/2-oxohepta-3-ene-1,7-dioic acid hydratase in catechol pathway
MWADLDGVRMQSGNTRAMIFSVAKNVSFLSEIFTLHPGDINATGTPPGVGIASPPDIVSLRGPHINRPTPRALDIDAVQQEMCKTLWLEPAPIVMTGIRNIHFYAGQHWR